MIRLYRVSSTSLIVSACATLRGPHPEFPEAHKPTKAIVFLRVNLRACASITYFANAGKEFAWRVLRKAPGKCDRRSPRILTRARPMSSSIERLSPGFKASPANRGSRSVALKSYGMGTWGLSNPRLIEREFLWITRCLPLIHAWADHFVRNRLQTTTFVESTKSCPWRTTG